MSVHFVHTIDNIMYLVICSFSLIGSVKFINLIILSHVGLIFNWPFHLWWHTFFLLYHATLCLVLTSYYFITSMDRCVCILVQFTRLGKRQCVLFTVRSFLNWTWKRCRYLHEIIRIPCFIPNPLQLSCDPSDSFGRYLINGKITAYNKTLTWQMTIVNSGDTLNCWMMRSSKFWNPGQFESISGVLLYVRQGRKSIESPTSSRTILGDISHAILCEDSKILKSVNHLLRISLCSNK